MTARCLLFVCLALACQGQTVEFGVKAGVPLSETFVTAYVAPYYPTSATRRYTVGPMVRVWLPHGFGVEFDALCQRLGYHSNAFEPPGGDIFTGAVGNSWEFPILGMFRFLRLPVQRYVSGGPAFRALSNVSDMGSRIFLYGPAGPELLPGASGDRLLANRSGRGVTVAMGGEARFGLVRVSPEFRYTRWKADAQEGLYLPYSNQNQLEAVLA